jgi:hypothetical protein
MTNTHIHTYLFLSKTLLDLFLYERSKGKQLITAPSRKGRFDKQSYFNKDFIHIFEKDAYCDYVLVRRKYRLAEKAKDLNPKTSFVPSNVPHKPSGKGSLFGTFEHQYPMFKKDDDNDGAFLPNTDDTPKTRNVKSAPTEHMKNFVTAPPKKGTGYGYVDVTIGSPYEYEPSPFDLPKELEQKERLRNQSLCISKRPFISASRPIEVFDPSIYSTPRSGMSCL